VRGPFLFYFYGHLQAKIKHIIEGNELVFYPEKYIHDLQNNSIILSDLHLGKTMHFRKNGIAIPKNLGLENLKRLNAILNLHNPKELLILGDLFHSKMNAEWDDFKALRYHFSGINFILVEGNHDSFDIMEYQKANILRVKELRRNRILYTHEPKKSSLLNCCGHIHPAVRLRGSALQSLKFPCFYMDGKQMILPAFGVFTGTHTIKVSKQAKVFAIVENKIFEAKHKLLV